MCTISSSSSSSSVLQRKSPHTEGAWEALAKNTPFGLNNLSLTTSHSRGWWRGFTQYAQRSQIFFHDSFRLPWTLKREFRPYPPLILSSSLVFIESQLDKKSGGLCSHCGYEVTTLFFSGSSFYLMLYKNIEAKILWVLPDRLSDLSELMTEGKIANCLESQLWGVYTHSADYGV